MGAAQATLKAEAEADGSGAAADADAYNARVISSTDEDFRLRYRLQRTIGRPRSPTTSAWELLNPA